MSATVILHMPKMHSGISYRIFCVVVVCHKSSESSDKMTIGSSCDPHFVIPSNILDRLLDTSRARPHDWSHEQTHRIKKEILQQEQDLKVPINTWMHKGEFVHLCLYWIRPRQIIQPPLVLIPFVCPSPLPSSSCSALINTTPVAAGQSLHNTRNGINAELVGVH